MLDRKTVKRPKVGELVATRVGDAKVTKVQRNGLVLTVESERHGTETIERADNGWWTVRLPIAWGGWNQGFYPSVRKAVKAAGEWLNHPDRPESRDRLWIIRHDTRPGWRLVNCGSRQPMIAEMEQGFYGPLTAENIAAKLKEHKA